MASVDHQPVEIVLIATHDGDVGEITGLQSSLGTVLYLHQSVDFRGIRHRAANCQFAIDGINQYLLHRTDLALEFFFADLRL